MLLQNKKSFLNGDISKLEYFELVKPYHECLSAYIDLIEDSAIDSIIIKQGKIMVSFLNPPISLYLPKYDLGNPAAMTLYLGEYEKEYALKMMSMMEGKSVIFDVGTNIGYYSISAAKLYPESKIYAFEAAPITFSELEANIFLNKLCNITPVQVALSHSEGKETIFYNPLESGAASLRNIRDTADAIQITTVTMTMDKFAEKNNAYPDFIKCDVEGAELYVLKGAANVLGKARPIVFIEILRKWCAKFGHTANDVVDFLKNFDYTPHVLRGEKLEEIELIDDEMVDTNFIFIP